MSSGRSKTSDWASGAFTMSNAVFFRHFEVRSTGGCRFELAFAAPCGGPASEI